MFGYDNNKGILETEYQRYKVAPRSNSNVNSNRLMDDIKRNHFDFTQKRGSNDYTTTQQLA